MDFVIRGICLLLSIIEHVMEGSGPPTYLRLVGSFKGEAVTIVPAMFWPTDTAHMIKTSVKESFWDEKQNC